MDTFDFSAPAELYVQPQGVRRKGGVTFKKFATGAEAIRHAIESQDGAALRGTTVETEGARVEGAEIRALYESAAYPLPRRTGT